MQAVSLCSVLIIHYSETLFLTIIYVGGDCIWILEEHTPIQSAS